MGAMINLASGSPAVVIDKVAMTYTIPAGGMKGEEGIRPAISRLVGKGGGTEIYALKELSLVAMHGEVIGVIGLNGSGKSTLMKLISGKINPSRGQVYASSTPIMLGVSAALVPDLSGAHNIMLGCLAMGMSNQDIARKYDSILELSGLEESIHLPMRSYSSGMASRLRFAIAAAIDPEILIIDEALNTGDDEFKDRTKNGWMKSGHKQDAFSLSATASIPSGICARASSGWTKVICCTTGNQSKGSTGTGSTPRSLLRKTGLPQEKFVAGCSVISR